MKSGAKPSPLHLAARGGHLDVVNLLLEHGVDVNTMSDAGTALHEAGLYGKTEVVKSLLAHGVNVDAKNSMGQSTLDLLAGIPSQKAQDVRHILMAHAGGPLKATAIMDYSPSVYDESALAFKAGDVIHIVDRNESGWWKGTLNARTGVFPHTYVELIKSEAGQADTTDSPEDPFAAIIAEASGETAVRESQDVLLGDVGDVRTERAASFNPFLAEVGETPGPEDKPALDASALFFAGSVPPEPATPEALSQPPVDPNLATLWDNPFADPPSAAAGEKTLATAAEAEADPAPPTLPVVSLAGGEGASEGTEEGTEEEEEEEEEPTPQGPAKTVTEWLMRLGLADLIDTFYDSGHDSLTYLPLVCRVWPGEPALFEGRRSVPTSTHPLPLLIRRRDPADGPGSRPGAP